MIAILVPRSNLYKEVDHNSMSAQPCMSDSISIDRLTPGRTAHHPLFEVTLLGTTVTFSETGLYNNCTNQSQLALTKKVGLPQKVGDTRYSRGESGLDICPEPKVKFRRHSYEVQIPCPRAPVTGFQLRACLEVVLHLRDVLHTSFTQLGAVVFEEIVVLFLSFPGFQRLISFDLIISLGH